MFYIGNLVKVTSRYTNMVIGNYLTYLSQRVFLSMGSLFILIWTENAPPLSVQIKIKRDLTLGNVSFYLNLDRHQDLAQSRVYQCAKTSKSRHLKLYFGKVIFY